VLRTEFLRTLPKLLHRTAALRGHDVGDFAPFDDRKVRVSLGERGGATPAALEFDILLPATACSQWRASPTIQKQCGKTAASPSSTYSSQAIGRPADTRTFPTVANRGDSELVMGHFTTAALFPQGRDRLTVALGRP
jgi:hypothetical protein